MFVHMQPSFPPSASPWQILMGRHVPSRRRGCWKICNFHLALRIFNCPFRVSSLPFARWHLPRELPFWWVLSALPCPVLPLPCAAPGPVCLSVSLTTALLWLVKVETQLPAWKCWNFHWGQHKTNEHTQNCLWAKVINKCAKWQLHALSKGMEGVGGGRGGRGGDPIGSWEIKLTTSEAAAEAAAKSCLGNWTQPRGHGAYN